jgi:hypothetical protein
LKAITISVLKKPRREKQKAAAICVSTVVNHAAVCEFQLWRRPTTYTPAIEFSGRATARRFRDAVAVALGDAGLGGERP